jgi:hypothetical protein
LDSRASAPHGGVDENTICRMPTPPGFAPGRSFYDAIGFSVDGVAIASPVIGIYDDLFQTFDCVDVTSGVGTPVVDLCALPDTLFSGQAPAVAENLQLAGLFEAGLVLTPVTSFSLLTLAQSSSVPSPPHSRCSV